MTQILDINALLPPSRFKPTEEQVRRFQKDNFIRSDTTSASSQLSSMSPEQLHLHIKSLTSTYNSLKDTLPDKGAKLLVRIQSAQAILNDNQVMDDLVASFESKMKLPLSMRTESDAQIEAFNINNAKKKYEFARRAAPPLLSMKEAVRLSDEVEHKSISFDNNKDYVIPDDNDNDDNEDCIAQGGYEEEDEDNDDILMMR